MRNPYDVLGLSKSASEADIKRAYRRLAKASHPDANRNDPTSQERFSEINNAYAFLSDREKRAAFDRGDIDAAGNPRVQSFFRSSSGRPADFASSVQGFENVIRPRAGRFGRTARGSLFDDLFGPFGSGRDPNAHGNAKPFGFAPAAAAPLRLPIALEKAVRGGSEKLTLPSGKRISIKIPKNARNGQRIRLKSEKTAAPADATGVLAEIVYRPHKEFIVENDTVYLAVPVTLDEAVFGATIPVPTLDGSVSVTVPAGAQSGQRLRVRGKGVPTGPAQRGDLILILMISVPMDTPGIRALAQTLREHKRSGSR